MIEEEISFPAGDAVLNGRLLIPQNDGACAAIVMSHGFTGVADQLLPQARAFAAAGFAVLLFDNPGFGRSGGTPRQEVDPARQIDGIIAAISYACARSEIDADRIGLWGTSLAGGNAIAAAARDPRIGCVVAQVPFISGGDMLAGRPDRDALLARMQAEPAALAAGAAPSMEPVIGASGQIAILMGRAAHRYFAAAAPLWRNAVTLSSLAKLQAYEPGLVIDRIAPRPLLMIVADADRVTPTKDALAAFARAGEPKKLVSLSGGHFVPYKEAYDACVEQAIGWFDAHLARAGIAGDATGRIIDVRSVPGAGGD